MTATRTIQEVAADPQPGDIYNTSWGYDQTNVEFFQVVKRTPGTVTVRRIAERVKDGRLWPVADHWRPDWSLGTVGPEDEKTYSEKVCRLSLKARKYEDVPSVGRSLTIDNVRTAWPWDGRGEYDTFASGGQGH